MTLQGLIPPSPSATSDDLPVLHSKQDLDSQQGRKSRPMPFIGAHGFTVILWPLVAGYQGINTEFLNLKKNDS